MRPLDLAQSNSFPNGMGVESIRRGRFLASARVERSVSGGDPRQDFGEGFGEGFDGPAGVGVGEGRAGGERRSGGDRGRWRLALQPIVSARRDDAPVDWAWIKTIR